MRKYLPLLCLLFFFAVGCSRQSADPAWLPTDQDYLNQWVKVFHYTSEGGKATAVRTLFKTAAHTVEAVWSLGEEHPTYTQTEPAPGNSTLVNVGQLPTYVTMLHKWYADIFGTENYQLLLGSSKREDVAELIDAYPTVVCRVIEGTFHPLADGYSKDDLYGLALFSDSTGAIKQLVLLEGQINR